MVDELRKRITGWYCTYCGQMANTEEHFPPRSLTSVGLIISACKECNQFASTLWAFDFEERCNYVKMKIKDKYKKCLQTPDWSDNEIKELKYNLRCGVRKWQFLKKITQERIAWNAIGYLISIDHNNYFAQFCARIDGIIKEEKRIWTNIVSKKSEWISAVDWK